ncbi:hypothetical protein HYQ45_000400 [Verticillium longisporum]|uniref:Uncharacterized protein n=1 Tax=Verticillium longisporum TaxID=100787 RepID=A0A8I3AXM9_VERLO|nr:hypothetical protein HYQ45_000400 [Verticillium longisporum]
MPTPKTSIVTRQPVSFFKPLDCSRGNTTAAASCALTTGHQVLTCALQHRPRPTRTSDSRVRSGCLTRK